MSLPIVPGYEGFESPEDLYPGTGNLPPLIYSGAYQTRQFGVGDSNALHVGNSVLSALANPSANMVTAASLAQSYIGGITAQHLNNISGYNYPVTALDQNRYFPAANQTLDGGAP
jgi:hypothetical protein